MSREDILEGGRTSAESSDHELLLFKSKEAYVYRVSPAGTVSQ